MLGSLFAVTPVRRFVRFTGWSVRGSSAYDPASIDYQLSEHRSRGHLGFTLMVDVDPAQVGEVL